MDIYLITQNKIKLAAAKHTSRLVAKELGHPTIREDHSVYLNGLDGIPGPYMNYFERKISKDKI